MKLCAVYDTKAQAHLNVATMRTSAEAIRQFETVCRDKNSQFSQHPSDFILKELADYDELSGLISPHDVPHILATASEFV